MATQQLQVKAKQMDYSTATGKMVTVKEGHTDIGTSPIDLSNVLQKANINTSSNKFSKVIFYIDQIN